MSTFFDRLLLVVSDRPLFAWGNAVGLGNASINRMKSGGEPLQKTARLICAIERASSEWLSAGKGSPFEVNVTQDADETLRAVAELLSTASELLLVHDGSRVAIAIATPISTDGHSYTEWRVIAGPVNTTLLEALRCEVSIRVAHAPPSDMQRLIDGHMGNWELIGNFGGGNRLKINAASLYNKAKPAPNWMAFKALTDRAFIVAPLAITHGVAERKSPIYGSLNMLIDKLPADQRDALELIVRGLLGQH